MRHSYQHEGFGVRLRPVRMDDAPFILWLRHLDRTKGRIGDSAANLSEQESWLTKYFERAGDYYFIAETLAATSLGTYGIYEHLGTIASAGRFILRPNVHATVPVAILACDLAYGTMQIKQLRANVVANNHAVITFDRSLGFREARRETATQMIGGIATDLVHLEQDERSWRAARGALLAAAQWSERRLCQWENRALTENERRPWLPTTHPIG
jgi:RimJ/RimL family protein N-acetyltransferase